MRIVIITNRLPLTVAAGVSGIRLKQSSGGVVAGLKAYVQTLGKTEYVWIGWPGVAGLSAPQERDVTKQLKTRHLKPVFLTQAEMEGFYNGFSNDTIWPLFHTFPSYATYRGDQWETYVQVNQHFCDVAREIIQWGDVVWVHDYQLMLLPQLLRSVLPVNIPIGFFLHIPFPDFEIFRLLPAPWRRQILEGLLGADMVGFHTYDYRHYFVNSVERVLGLEVGLEHVSVGDRNVRVDSFPMGIDFNKFHNAARLPKVRKAKAKHKRNFNSHRRVILSIDRLDYTKGIINRLRAFAGLLEKEPKWREEVQLLLVVVPSRTGVERYQEMKHSIDELVGQINGQFGTMSWSPIMYQYKSFGFSELTALYNLADVALVTPLRDGMNLVAKEYIASRRDKTGVLVLSEMAGSAQELQEAIAINPNHIEDITRGLEEALSVPRAKQIGVNKQLQARLSSYDVRRWGNDFIEQLKNSQQHVENNTRELSGLVKSNLLKQWKTARKPLLLLDYDGTLVNFANRPEKAKPPAAVQQLLRTLKAKATVAVISGRSRPSLNKWLRPTGVRLVAEHGAFMMDKRGRWDTSRVLANDWKEDLRPVLEVYSSRVPGSFVEEKNYSLAWHYRTANPELAQNRLQELLTQVTAFAAANGLQVWAGNKVVEISNAEVNKGSAVRYFLDEDKYDFILAAGDDVTDENLFKAMPKGAYSIKVGQGRSEARYRLANPEQVIKLLLQLT